MSLIKSKQRVADHGEVFTPDWLVEKMLDLVKGETERIDARFLEPACGSGNFLVPILQRKLAAVELKFGKSEFEKRHYALLALMCAYGVELLEDNIAECRANMLEVFADYLSLDEADDLYRAASYVLAQNLVHGDAMTMRAVHPLRALDHAGFDLDHFAGRIAGKLDLARCRVGPLGLKLDQRRRGHHLGERALKLLRIVVDVAMQRPRNVVPVEHALFAGDES